MQVPFRWRIKQFAWNWIVEVTCVVIQQAKFSRPNLMLMKRKKISDIFYLLCLYKVVIPVLLLYCCYLTWSLLWCFPCLCTNIIYWYRLIYLKPILNVSWSLKSKLILTIHPDLSCIQRGTNLYLLTLLLLMRWMRNPDSRHNHTILPWELNKFL